MLVKSQCTHTKSLTAVGEDALHLDILVVNARHALGTLGLPDHRQLEKKTSKFSIVLNVIECVEVKTVSRLENNRWYLHRFDRNTFRVANVLNPPMFKVFGGSSKPHVLTASRRSVADQRW